jgi:hypothetical protein
MSVKGAKHGFINGQMMLAVALVAAMGGMIARTAMEQANVSLVQRVSAELINQATMIRQSVNACTLKYPIPNSPYPAAPASNQARDTICPNHPDAGLVAPANAQAKVFNGSNGAFLPPPPPGWGEWQYVVSGSTISIQISATLSKASDQGHIEGAKRAFARFYPPGVAGIAATGTWTSDEAVLVVDGSSTLRFTLYLKK